MNEFEAELAAEITEENIVSSCEKCQGTGIIMVNNEFDEHAEECSCLRDWRENF